MSDKNIKMVALDLDGTTLNQYGRITDRTVAAFKKAMVQGVHIVISTGRTFQSLPKQLFTIEGLEYVVTSNGAHITELESMERIYENLLPEESVAAVVELIRKKGRAHISVETFIDGHAYIDKDEYEEIIAEGSTYRDAAYIRDTRNPVPQILDYMMAHKGEIENISLNFEFLEEKAVWREELAQIPDLTLTTSFIHNIEMGGVNTSKGTALAFLMERLGVSPAELMAVGDSPNDGEMMKLAGLGVAVANGTEETKAMADYVTASNAEDGVAKAIEKFVLQSRC